MTATQVQLKESTQDFINELTENNYAVDDIYEFIEQYGEDNFVQFYEEYVQCGEDYCYEAVDAFIDTFDIDCIQYFTDAYYGQYDSEEQFAEQFVDDCYSNQLQDLPIVIDWTQTWECNLRYDFDFTDGFVFHKNF
jgi:N-methylhydantoinase B/oxoprolinase/acetone carboxylase alpha subunit